MNIRKLLGLDKKKSYSMALDENIEMHNPFLGLDKHVLEELAIARSQKVNNGARWKCHHK